MTVPRTVIERDHSLAETAQRAGYDLDRFRWEQCSDPAGPRHTQQEYADAVDVTKSAVSKSIKAWSIALNKANQEKLPARETSKHGRTSTSEPVEEAAAAKAAADEAGETLTEPTPEQHKAAKASASAGELTAAVYAAVAKAFGKAPSTIQQNHLWKDIRNDAVVRVNAAVANGADHDAACTQVAADLKREDDHRQEHERNAKAREAADGSHPTWLLEILNIPIQGEQAMSRARRLMRGDPAAVRWTEESRDLLRVEVDRVRAIVDWLESLPEMEALTPESIIGGER